MKIRCFFGIHRWVCNSSWLADVETRQCAFCGKKQHFSGDWFEGKWRDN